MAAAVFAGGEAALGREDSDEVALVVEAAFDGDVRDELVGRFQQLARGVQPDFLDQLAGRDAVAVLPEGARLAVSKDGKTLYCKRQTGLVLFVR